MEKAPGVIQYGPAAHMCLYYGYWTLLSLRFLCAVNVTIDQLALICDGLILFSWPVIIAVNNFNLGGMFREPKSCVWKVIFNAYLQFFLHP